MRKILSPWSKQIKKAMIDRDMDTNDVAAELHCTRQYVSAVVNGCKYYPEAVERISEMFGVDVPESDKAILSRKKTDLEIVCEGELFK